MMVQVIVEIYSGIIDEVTVFRFKEDAQQYYESNDGPALENNPLSNHEIKWFQDVPMRSMPIEAPEVETE